MTELTDKITTGSLLYDLDEQIRKRIEKLKKERPLLKDFLTLLLNQLYETIQKFTKTSPHTSELKTSVFLRLISTNDTLDAIQWGEYPYLADKDLYKVLLKGLQNNLVITNEWVKLLVVVNTLELVVNDALSQIDKAKYYKMKQENASFISKVTEINEYLKRNGKQEINTLKLKNITAQRNSVDHPDSETILQIDEKLVFAAIEVVGYVIDTLKDILGTKKN